MTSNAHSDLLKAFTMNVSRQQASSGRLMIDLIKREIFSLGERLRMTQAHPVCITR
jgi:hypothetical protein